MTRYDGAPSHREICENPTYYYDASALMLVKNVREMVNMKEHGYWPVISHLALGEAVGNLILKPDFSEEDVTKFVELLQLMHGNGLVAIIGNDCDWRILYTIQEEFRLNVADAVHVSTAIDTYSEVFVHKDSDFDSENMRRDEVEACCSQHRRKTLRFRKLRD